MSYIGDARSALILELGDDYRCEDDLVDLYTLLVLTTGTGTTLEDVHDAWGVWRNRTIPDHDSLVPFDKLEPEIQAYDEPYRDAIVAVAERL